MNRRLFAKLCVSSTIVQCKQTDQLCARGRYVHTYGMGRFTNMFCKPQFLHVH